MGHPFSKSSSVKSSLTEAFFEKCGKQVAATPERDEILLFVKDSKRGIIRGYFPD
ncbi:hypothetical protein [Gaoshiqia sediminis]|uniref:Uncharacterized protein n=1 Tax=Gaoshiqia sediminis TaxID=2986998 RepID=A0AA42C7L2_9BACT|nr:hypothetical protein [Gaoshiqia sediminis]MCW0485103.1 hypothetical protein [Gaoshiqia sediminis]